MSVRSAHRSTRALLRVGSLAAGITVTSAIGAPASGTAQGAPATRPATATTRSSTPARPTPARYVATAVAPRALADGTPVTASVATGISDSGAVAGNTVAGGNPERPFLTTGRRVRLLPNPSPTGYGRPTATDVSPNGRVAANFSSPNRVAGRWNAVGALTTMQEVENGYYGSNGTAVNRSGQVAACQSSVKVGFPALWSSAGVPSTPAMPRSGNCTISGLSDAGAAVMTLTHPMFRNDGAYPNAYLVTRNTVTSLTPGRPTGIATADAISPSGRYVVGRVGGTESAPGPAAWLSTTRRPAPLAGGAGLTPTDVDDTGRVVGVAAGRAVLWSKGRLTDLTRNTRGLPAGWTVVSADGINSRGDIAATAKNAAGVTLALRLTSR